MTSEHHALSTNAPSLTTVWWAPGATPPAFDPGAVAAAIPHIREPAYIIRDGARGRLGIGLGGRLDAGGSSCGSGGGAGGYPVVGSLPALFPEWLGDRVFTEAYNLRFPYVTGEMANGISTTHLVIAMARHGMLGFFGAAGLSPARVERALDDIEGALGSDPTAPAWGTNLIHSPASPALEDALADLYVRRGVRYICASAFMALTPAVVRCAASGLARDSRGQVVRRHHIFAKLSRPEVAEHFMGPAPRPLLQGLVDAGQLTPEEAALAQVVPVAEEITVEADSGGHTDNRPLGALLPVILTLRDRMVQRYAYPRPIRVGAAGGLGTPAAVAAAFAMGAAYVVTGTVNQASVESGLAANGKRLLAEAGIADVMMAPAADMFEMGVKVQVLRRGTMFGMRALRLYELYRTYDSLESLPPETKTRLESEILGLSCDQVWAEVQRYFRQRDPGELIRAEREPKHRMALVFRWYLGLSSKWAIAGEPGRRLDCQIWCGPAMGAFNDWVRGSFLEAPERRSVVQIALNLLEGAAVITRAQQVRSAGVTVPPAAFVFRPRPLEAA